LQNDLIGAACDVNRWIRREIWKLRQEVASLAATAQAAGPV
jgi:hypothetical protein